MPSMIELSYNHDCITDFRRDSHSCIYKYRNTPSVFLPPSASTSAGLSSFPAGVTHTFLPEESVPFVTLPGLGYYSFPLTLITGYGSTKRCPKESLVLQT